MNCEVLKEAFFGGGGDLCKEEILGNLMDDLRAVGR